MTGETYLICHECKRYIYACKHKYLERRKHESQELASFINEHAFFCDGTLDVWDECCIPPDDTEYSQYFLNEKIINEE